MRTPMPGTIAPLRKTHAGTTESIIPRCNVLGVGVSAINPAVALETIGGWIAERRSHYVCVTGVHGVMESLRDPDVRRIHNEAGLVTPDGMPLVWVSRLRGFAGVDRVYGPDLMLALCASSPEKGYRHFLYGGREGVAKRLAASLQGRLPGLEVVGTYCPPFRPLTEEEDARVVDQINRSGADVVWVGLSTPKQELDGGPPWQDRRTGHDRGRGGRSTSTPAWSPSGAGRWIQRSGAGMAVPAHGRAPTALAAG